MIVLLVIDLQHQILPNEITLPGIVVGLAFSLVGAARVARRARSAPLAGGGVLWLIAWGYERWRGVEGLGFGDVKMLAMIGAFLGWKLMLLTLVVASLLGSLTAAGAAARAPRRLAVEAAARHLPRASPRSRSALVGDAGRARGT